MKVIFLVPMMLFGFLALGQNVESKKDNPSTYLSELKKEMQIEWPKNRTINIVGQISLQVSFTIYKRISKNGTTYITLKQ